MFGKKRNRQLPAPTRPPAMIGIATSPHAPDRTTRPYGYDNKNHLIHAPRETTDGGAIELAADYQ